MSVLKVGNRRFRLPRSRFARIAIGVLLVLGGVLGFLPILGFWMVPLGVLVLSYDLAFVRRWRRQMEVGYSRWRRGGPSGHEEQDGREEQSRANRQGR